MKIEGHLDFGDRGSAVGGFNAAFSGDGFSRASLKLL
jgi:hypothetical protein